ncbi:MAG: ParB/RepB/Spo0J family partition protein [candidate division WOR-3 bacterium]
MKEKRRLGRGLEALISDGLAGPDLVSVPVDRIDPNPRQPRAKPEEEIESLTASIGRFGVLQPVLVREHGDRYELIAGQRRWMAAVAAGLERIPAIIMDADDAVSLELALVENLQRRNLNPVEEARAILHLSEDFGMTHEEIGQAMGTGRATVTNKLRLLSLPEPVLRLLEEGKVTEGHARALLGLNDPQEQERVARLIMEKGLTVRDTERLVSGERKTLTKKKAPTPEERQYETTLASIGIARARVRLGKKKIVLTMEFKTREEFDGFLGKIKEREQ